MLIVKISYVSCVYSCVLFLFNIFHIRYGATLSCPIKCLDYPWLLRYVIPKVYFVVDLFVSTYFDPSVELEDQHYFVQSWCASRRFAMTSSLCMFNCLLTSRIPKCHDEDFLLKFSVVSFVWKYTLPRYDSSSPEHLIFPRNSSHECPRMSFISLINFSQVNLCVPCVYPNLKIFSFLLESEWTFRNLKESV